MIMGLVKTPYFLLIVRCIKLSGEKHNSNIWFRYPSRRVVFTFSRFKQINRPANDNNQQQKKHVFVDVTTVWSLSYVNVYRR